MADDERKQTKVKKQHVEEKKVAKKSTRKE